MSRRSRHRGLARAVMIVVAGAGLITVVGCSSSSKSSHPPSGKVTPSATATAPGPTATPLTVGRSEEFFSQFAGEQGTTLRVAVNSIKYATSVPGPGTTPFKPTRGFYIIMSLTVTNTGQAPGAFNAPNFVWVSARGQLISDVGVALGGAAPDQGQDGATLQPGQHATGTEYFDVPAKGGQLDYEIGSGAAPLLVIGLPSH